MDTIIIKRIDWTELDGKWQELVRDSYHPAYNGMGEYYSGIATADEKIENMKTYMINIPTWTAWAGENLTGFITGKIKGTRLVLYDLFVATAFRRQGIGRQLLETAIRDSGATIITAEVNRENSASQELFRLYNFQRTATSDWLELHISTEEK